MATMTTGTHPKSLWPGVFAFWGIKYPEHEVQYKDLMEWKTSTKAYEELVETIGMGLAPVKSEGTPITFDSTAQGVVNRATHVAYGLGANITYEAIQDGQYENLGMQAAEALKFAMRQTKENVVANVYNRAFNSSYTYGDGVSLVSTAHPTAAGDQSNRLSSNADLSEVAIEDMTIQIMDAKTSKGHPFKLMPKSLHVPTAEFYNAIRILKSTLQNDTAENAVNALKYAGVFTEGAKVNNYFTSTTAWFVRTNAPNGLIGFDREKLSFDKDNDFLTSDARFKTYERYSTTVGDWRSIFGSS